MTSPGRLMAAIGGAALLLGGAVVWARRKVQRTRE
ncbi:MAG: LPXTG cell wall anchor domain-containing protein [Thermomicrobiales bacterium]